MKPLFLIITLISLNSVAFGQEVARSILTTAGDYSKNESGVSLSWTLGDVFVQTTQQDQHLTEGFQQGELNNPSETQNSNARFDIDPTAPTVEEELIVNVVTYPNPTVDKLSLKIETTIPQMAIANVYNLDGKRVLQQNINMENGKDIQIENIQNLIAGTYFIDISKNGNIIVTKKFVKVAL